MTKWNYGDAYKRVEFKGDRIDFEDGFLFVHDIMNELPKEMLSADLLFVDPPWNLGNINTFYTKADLLHIHRDYLVLDEEKIIEWVMANEKYECAGDLCMGQGLVALNAFKNGKRFVGTELNRKRLAVCAERLLAQGAQIK